MLMEFASLFLTTAKNTKKMEIAHHAFQDMTLRMENASSLTPTMPSHLTSDVLIGTGKINNA